MVRVWLNPDNPGRPDLVVGDSSGGLIGGCARSVYDPDQRSISYLDLHGGSIGRLTDLRKEEYDYLRQQNPGSPELPPLGHLMPPNPFIGTQG